MSKNISRVERLEKESTDDGESFKQDLREITNEVKRTREKGQEVKADEEAV